jgi:pinin/SDK/memA/ protein conserved region
VRVHEADLNAQSENVAGNPDSELGTRLTKARGGREEEHRRGKRMFGALLGALGQGQGQGGTRSKQRQPSGVSDEAIQRRLEIEKRAQEKLRRMTGDPLPLTKEEEERLRRRRIEVQREVDEQTVGPRLYRR